MYTFRITYILINIYLFSNKKVPILLITENRRFWNYTRKEIIMDTYEVVYKESGSPYEKVIYVRGVSSQDAWNNAKKQLGNHVLISKVTKK